MALMLALAGAAMVQPAAAPAPVAADYAVVAARESRQAQPLEKWLAGVSDGRDRRGRSRLPIRKLQRCVDPAAPVDRVNQCLRALVPPPQAGRPAVAVAIREVRRSNVTGSVVRISHDVYCIGYRSVGRAQFGSSLDALLPGERAGVVQAIRECMAEAATRSPYFPLREEASGPALLPISQFALARDAGHARGIGGERALIRFDDPRVHKPGNERACYLRARVTEVEGGELLRRGDTIQLRIGCGSEDQNAFRFLIGEQPLPAGAAARIYIGGGGRSAHFLERL